MESPNSLRRARLAAAPLYLLATRRFARIPLVDAVAAACRGGVGVVQVREKGVPDAEMLAAVREIAAVVREAGALLLVNDHVALALEVGADGAHVGPGDMPVAEARRLLGPDLLLGATTHDLAQARRAAAEGADYVGIGPVFPTETKGVPVRAIGPEAAGRTAAGISIPAFAIGGIGPANVRRVREGGCRRVAVCAAILGSPDPEAVARQILATLSNL